MKRLYKTYMVFGVIAISIVSSYLFLAWLLYTKILDLKHFNEVQAEYKMAFSIYQKALQLKSPDLLKATLEICRNVKTNAPTQRMKFDDLKLRTLYASDTLKGIVYLNSKNTMSMSLLTTENQSLTSPIDFTFFQDKLFIIDSGSLYAGNLKDLQLYGDTVYLSILLGPGRRIDGHPVQNIVAVDSVETDNMLYILDQSGNVYCYNIRKNEWCLVQLYSSKFHHPSPLYLNLCAYKNRIYLIDQARNQIWRHPPNTRGSGVLEGKLPWLLEKEDLDVSSGIDLSVDGNFYVLTRNGNVIIISSDKVERFHIDAVSELCHVEGFIDLPSYPTAIFTKTRSTTLYIADSGLRSIFAVDKNDYKLTNQYVAPDNLDFAYLRGIAEFKKHLYMLAGNKLYAYNYRNNAEENNDLTGRLPILEKVPDYGVVPSDLPPNDPRLPPILKKYGFQLPIKNALLPDRSAVYPGSRRLYRYGVHEGLDFGTKDIGVQVDMDTPVTAAGEGVVIRADIGYKEMTLNEVSGLIDSSKANRITSSEALNKLGGRQIWIDHGEGVATAYKHLSGIAEGIFPGQVVESGQIIGYVGLSGTLNGIRSSTYYPHLHFEIRIGPEYQHYIGKWLSIEETRRAYEQIFHGVKVRPAYLDFRSNNTLTTPHSSN